MSLSLGKPLLYQIATNHEDSLQSMSAKRLRREYDGKPADGLRLLLDLMPLTTTFSFMIMMGSYKLLPLS